MCNDVDYTGREFIKVTLPGGDLASELLSDLLRDLGADGVNVVQDSLLAFFPSKIWTEEVEARIRSAFSSLSGDEVLPEGNVTIEHEKELDWVGKWRKSLGPIHAGTKFVVVPHSIEVDEAEDRYVLRLEPKMAFGTGDHPTTRMALELLERTVQKGDRLVDMGIGNGVLSIAALMLGAGYAFGIDNEQESVDESAVNAKLHGYSDQIDVVLGDVITCQLPETYDLLVANIFISPIFRSLPSWLEHLKPGGRCVFTGIQAFDADRLKAGLEKHNIFLEEILEQHGWIAARGVYQPA